MKFLHMADMHFDAPFSSLNSKKNLGETRRLEQRNVFKEIIKYVKENDIDYLFISGDLYEHEYVRKSTIDFINNCFKEIENTKVFITPEIMIHISKIQFIVHMILLIMYIYLILQMLKNMKIMKL